jgi:hypothetical protein
MPELQNAVFVRDITVRHGEKITPGRITIGGVDRDEHGTWRCHWSVTPLYARGGVTYGEDPLQALTLCIEFVDSIIQSAQSNSVAAWWLTEGDQCRLLRPGRGI